MSNVVNSLRRFVRKIDSLCIQCGAAAAEDSQYCPECRDAHRASQRAYDSRPDVRARRAQRRVS